MAKLRHWKQRFNKDAKFVWTRSILYAGATTVAGEIVPDELSKNAIKLRRFWESGVIELKEFKAPDVQTGQVVLKKEEKVIKTKLKNGKYKLVTSKRPNGVIVSQAKLELACTKLLDELED